MRSSPILIAIVIITMSLGLSWALDKPFKDPKSKFVARTYNKLPPDTRKDKSVKKTSNAAARTNTVPIYKPPKRGAPGGRVGGATRGDHETHFMVEILAPEKVRGLTSHDQPDLYWYLSSPTDIPIEFTLIDEEGVEPLVEVRLPQPMEGGIQRVRLSDYDIHLTEDKMYRWSIALVMDPERRSKDIVAGARIQRAFQSEIPTEKLAGSDPLRATFIQAEAGLWYDCMASISQAIHSGTSQSRGLEVRAALLEQVGLAHIATLDRKRLASF